VLLASACATSNVAVAPPPPHARLVVTMVIDQFAAWIADDRLEKLPPGGGFARLRREGVWLHAMQYDYAATDTAAGHLALYTGLPPRDTGLPRNEVCVEPPNGPAKRVSSFATTPGDVATGLLAPAELQVEATKLPGIHLALAPGVKTLADQLRSEGTTPARILSVSLKDRAAIPGGGAKPDAVLWYEKKLDAFVSSRSFLPQFPRWAERNPELVEQLRQRPWGLLDRGWISDSGVIDARPTEEGDIGCGDAPGCAGGFGITFPHVFPQEIEARKLAFRSSPRADEAVLVLALNALDAVPLPAGSDGLTLLAISLSANDYIGHTFTDDSVESWDETRRLDELLATFFTALDLRYGADGWSILLTADHGAMSTAGKVMDRETGKPLAHRRMPLQGKHGEQGLFDILNRELRQPGRLDPPADQPLLCPFTDPYLDFTAAARKHPAFASVVEKLVANPPQELRRLGVARIVDTSNPPACGKEDDFICKTLVPDPEQKHTLFFVPEKGAFFDPDLVPGFGTSHGTPHEYDRTVPLLVRAPHAVPSAEARAEAVPFTLFRQTAWCLLSGRAPCPGPWSQPPQGPTP
jgi:hypothetical protein